MNFFIIIESVKFYKLRHEKTVQLWFILLYAINISAYILPISDPDLSKLMTSVENLLAGQAVDMSIGNLFTTGNLIFMGLLILISLINAIFILIYATLYVGEAESIRPADSIRKSLSALPRLIFLGLLLVVPAMLSTFIFMIPLIVFIMMMYFLPLNLALDHLPLHEAMHQSYASTKHQKLFIFLQVMMLSIFVSLPQTIIFSFAPTDGLAYVILATFFSVLQVFVQGRLMGILYLFLVKKVPIVITSKPNDQK